MDKNTIYVVTGIDDSAMTRVMEALVEGGMRAAYDPDKTGYSLSNKMVFERHFPLRYHGKLIKLPVNLTPLLTPQKNITYKIVGIGIEDIDISSRNDVLFMAEDTFTMMYAMGWPIDIDKAEERFNQ